MDVRVVVGIVWDDGDGEDLEQMRYGKGLAPANGSHQTPSN